MERRSRYMMCMSHVFVLAKDSLNQAIVTDRRCCCFINSNQNIDFILFGSITHFVDGLFLLFDIYWCCCCCCSLFSLVRMQWHRPTHRYTHIFASFATPSYAQQPNAAAIARTLKGMGERQQWTSLFHQMSVQNTRSRMHTYTTHSHTQSFVMNESA